MLIASAPWWVPELPVTPTGNPWLNQVEREMERLQARGNYPDLPDGWGDPSPGDTEPLTVEPTSEPDPLDTFGAVAKRLIGRDRLDQEFPE